MICTCGVDFDPGDGSIHDLALRCQTELGWDKVDTDSAGWNKMTEALAVSPKDLFV